MLMMLRRPGNVLIPDVLRGRGVTAMRRLALMLIVISGFGCSEEGDIVEKPPSVLRGTITDESSVALQGVEISFKAWDGNQYSFQHVDVSDSAGAYDVIIGMEPLPCRIWRFEKTGYRSAHYLIPEETARLGENSYNLNVVLPAE